MFNKGSWFLFSVVPLCSATEHCWGEAGRCIASGCTKSNRQASILQNLSAQHHTGKHTGHNGMGEVNQI